MKTWSAREILDRPKSYNTQGRPDHRKKSRTPSNNDHNSFIEMATIDPTIEAVFGAAPAGVNLDESVTTLYSIISCVGLGLAIASVALRFYVRTMHSFNTLGADDYTMTIALVSSSLPSSSGCTC